ncbi:MAG TPA: oligosaccharide flippase family protein [Solirubrobacteraceae bacterium]|nr:oligosaccharide flippase family protein [Solirubrobacteraceae bacterium]
MSTIATSPRESAPPPEALKPERPIHTNEAGHRVARNLSALLGGQAITWTVTLAWTVVVPRALGPAGLGILVSAQSVSGVLGIVLGLGTRNYLVRESVMHPGDGPRLVGTALVLRILIAPVVGLAAVVWARVAGDGHEAATVLYLITAMTVLTLITEPLQAAFQAIERMKYLAYADIINKSAQSLIGIALVLVGFKVVGIAANMAIVSIVVLVITFWWLRPHFTIDVRTSLSLMGHMARQSLAYWAFGLFGMVYFWIDTIMLSLMTRPAVVGWYGVTSQLFQTLMFLPVLVQTAWLPRLVSAFASGHRELNETARAPVELIFAISVPIAVAMGLIADPLIHAVYGSGYAQAVPVMVILAFCVPPIYLNIILATVLLAAKRQRVWTIVMAAAAVINPLFNLVLIPLTEHRDHNGAIGAAFALVLTEVLMDAVGLFLIGRDVFDRRMVRRCGLVCVASASMAGVAYGARSLGTEISLALGFATFGVLVAALRVVREEELALVRDGLSRLRRGGGAPAQERPVRPARPPATPASPAPFAADRGVDGALAIARRTGLRELLDPAPSRERELCAALILGRVICAGSELGTAGALSRTTLARKLCAANVDDSDLGAAIDWLLERKDAIEARLASRHLANGVAVLHDVSSCDHPRVLGGSGGPRAHASRRPRLVYGLLCDTDGRPVAIEPLTGRPREDGSLRSQTARLGRRFGLSSVVVVADRRLFTEAAIQELSAADGADWITTLDATAIQRLARAKILEPSESGEQEIWEIAAGDGWGDERLIACRTSSVTTERALTRDQLLSATESDLAAIADRVNRGALRGADRIWLAVGPALNRHRMRKYFQVTVTGETVSYSRDAGGIAAAATLDGVTVVRTSLVESAVPAPDVVRLYDDLARGEQALGSLEDLDLERLAMHRRPRERVRARALICMLAYHLAWHMTPRPQPQRTMGDS